MFRRMVTRILALGGIGLLLVASPARAQQQGWPYTGGNPYYGGGGQSFSGSYSRSYYLPSYSAPSYDSRSYYAPSYDSRSYYAPAYTEEPTSKRFVRVNLRVPSDAKIWFDENPTKQTGTIRNFESPPLDVGPYYSYQIRIQWKHDGKSVTQTRKVMVHAGDVINLTLGSSPASAPTP